MVRMDEWKEIPGFSKYEINRSGDVRHTGSNFVVFPNKHLHQDLFLRSDSEVVGHVDRRDLVHSTFFDNREK